MFLGLRKKYWYYLIASLLMIGLMVFFQLSPAFALKRIDWQGSFTKDLDKVSKDFLCPSQNLFRFDRKELAQTLLDREDIINAHLSLKFPDGIYGEINRFDPAALIIDNGLYAFDRHCRLIPYESTWDEISLPVFVPRSDSPYQVPKRFHCVR